MSLAAFQLAWLKLLFEPGLQTAWATGEIRERELSLGERASLQTICQSPLELSQRMQTQWVLSLQDALPLRVRVLLGDQSEPFVRYYLQSEALPPLFPKAHLQRQLLQRLRDYLEQAHLIIPHLRDLIAYELALSQLQYFGLPAQQSQAYSSQQGPTLAAWVQVVLLGAQFPVVLDQLKNRQRPDLSETQTQTFLLIQSFDSLHLEAVDPLLGECLQSCDGKQTWAQLIAACLARHPERDVQAETRALQPWEAHYLKREILDSANR